MPGPKKRVSKTKQSAKQSEKTSSSSVGSKTRSSSSNKRKKSAGSSSRSASPKTAKAKQGRSVKKSAASQSAKSTKSASKVAATPRRASGTTGRGKRGPDAGVLASGVLFSSPAEALEASRDFLIENRLGMLADQLPKKLSMTPAAEQSLSGAIDQGFGPVFVFPPLHVQSAAFEAMMDRLGGQPSASLEGDQQYGGPPWCYKIEALVASETADRPKGSYLLLMRGGLMPEESCNLTLSKIVRLFSDQGAVGLSMYEYLVIQRLMAERHGDHRFDDYYGHEDHPPGWQWLPATRCEGKSVMAYWNTKPQRVHLGHCGPGQKNPKKGAYPAVVVPIS